MKLVAFFSFDAAEYPDGTIGLTRKLVDDLELMARRWPGELIAVFAPRTHDDDSELDHEVFLLSSLPFRVVVLEPRSPVVAEIVEDAALVEIRVDYRHRHVARVCRSLGVPYVVVAEHDLRTRLQLVAAEEKRLGTRARRMAWELANEAQHRWSIAGAAGLQCNGTPTFDAWAHLNRNPLLFFDSRVRPSMLAGREDAERRGREADLHLAFSGRLVAMNGVLHLPELAARLQQAMRFILHVYGEGRLLGELKRRVRELGLEERVLFEGSLPVPELLARMREEIDLFVAPRVPGDPSSTYLEAMACAVPIAGFDNEALRGLLPRSHAGWAVPLRDIDALADLIVDLDRDREELRRGARGALRFAQAHTLDATVARRVDHLERVARGAAAAAIHA
jgi:colanic acid/amylovoran biosynthesis glycosyltransferase